MSADVLTTFRWEVSEGGYRIVEAGNLPDWAKTLAPLLMRIGKWPDNPSTQVVVSADPTSPVRSYQPFSPEHSALYKRVERVPPEGTAEVLALANQYGMLRGLKTRSIGEGDDLLVEATLREVLHSAPPSERAKARAALDEHKGRLSTSWYWQFEPLSDWFRLRDSLQAVLRTIPSRKLDIRDFRVGGAGYLINERLAQEDVRHRLYWHEGRLREGPVPSHLAGAIWLQLAFGLTRHAEYRTCANDGCRRPFEVAAGLTTGKRANAKFCSQACKSQDYRKRRAMAKELARQGVAPSKIAKVVVRNFRKSGDSNSPAALVRSWIGKTEGRPRKGGA